MSSSILRVAALLAALGVIAGCGGGASGGGNSGGGGNGGGGEANPTTVTFTITGPTPTAVATQTGSGSFTAATTAATGSGQQVILSLPSGTTKFAVAYVCPALSLTNSSSATQQTDEFLFEATTVDGTSFSGNCPELGGTGTTGSTGTLTGSVNANAIAGTWSVQITAWNANGTAEGSGFPTSLDSSFSFAAPTGSDTVAVSALQSSLVNGNEEVLTLLAAKTFSSQTVPGALNGGNTVVLGAADETTPEPITYSGVPTGFSTPSTTVTYSASGIGGYALTNGAGNTYPALPPGAIMSGGYYIISSGTYGYLNGTVDQAAGVILSTSTASPISISFPTPWAYAGPTPAALPTFDFSNSGLLNSANGYGIASLLWSLGGATDYYLQISATESYLSGSSSVAVPNLSNLQGFLAAPSSGASVQWYVSVYDGRSPTGGPVTSNETVNEVSNTGLYNVP